MAFLMVRIRDKVNSDFYLNCGASKRGDVIDVFPNTWVFGKEDQTYPDWRLIRCQSMSDSEARSWCAREVDTDPLHPSRTLQKRQFKVDLDALVVLAPALTAFLNDDTRSTPFLDVPRTDMRAVKFTKPPIIDPALVGSDSRGVLG